NTGSDSYVNYLLPGILLITIASGIAYTAFRHAHRRHGGGRRGVVVQPDGAQPAPLVGARRGAQLPGAHPARVGEAHAHQERDPRRAEVAHTLDLGRRREAAGPLTAAQDSARTRSSAF
ncbi:hypothetical protein ABZ297_36200, partial [Nonomuraea sp. NPDC005983]